MEIVQTPDTRRIEARRVDAFGEVLGEQSATISENDFTAIWQIIAQHRLESFTPKEKAGVVYDYGRQRLRIERTPENAADPVVHEVAWEKPLDNRAQVDPLLTAVAKLVQSRLEKVRLAYFPQ